MFEPLAEKSLDQLRRLLIGKPTAEDLKERQGGVGPHLHFVSLLPSSALPFAEGERVAQYFSSMLEALLPLRDSIAAYRLAGVMSRSPLTDFSLKIQLCDRTYVSKVLNQLPIEMRASV